MNYIDAMDFLEETKKYGSQLGLTSIQNLMAELGNIQDKIPPMCTSGILSCILPSSAIRF